MCIEGADCGSDGVWYLLIYVFIILNGRPLGMVAGRGRRRGKSTKQTAGVLLLSVDELLHEALPAAHAHGTRITKQSHANTQGTRVFRAFSSMFASMLVAFMRMNLSWVHTYGLEWGIIQCTEYLILGTVKSDGSLEIFTICGRLGNFSKIRNRRGSFSFVSALASLCFSCEEKPEDSFATNVSFCDSAERLRPGHIVFSHIAFKTFGGQSKIDISCPSLLLIASFENSAGLQVECKDGVFYIPFLTSDGERGRG